MVEEGWDVATLEETPFFRGWRARWEGGQGFGEGGLSECEVEVREGKGVDGVMMR